MFVLLIFLSVRALTSNKRKSVADMYQRMRFFLNFLLLALPAWGLEIVTGELPVAIIGRPYAPEPLSIQGGGMCAENGVSVKVAFGPLPEGVRLTPAGYFHGTPWKEGAYTFIVRAANACQVATRTYTLRVDGAPILVASEEALEFAYTVGAHVPPAQVFHVAANRRDLPYECEAPGSAWLDWRPLRGRTPMEGSSLQGDPVDVLVNVDKVAAGVYRTVLRCTAWQASREARVGVTLTVRPSAQ